MPFLNLIRDPWIPVATKFGNRRTICPADIVTDIQADPITEILWPRADFRAATLEFLIGLVTTAFPPEDNTDWKKWWDTPPSREELVKGLEPFEMAFNFDGDGPRFLQDLDDLGHDTSSISGLLIEQPGAQTEKNNADLFTKRGQVQVLSRSTAAVTLYTLQTFAPAGGAGHRTSMRGGGPLTTLALPSSADESKNTFWHRLWLNVVTLFDPIDHGEPLDIPERTFPWLGKTRTSDKGGLKTTLTDMHQTQHFWGMPRRIRLLFEANTERLPCDVTGSVEDVIVRSYVTRPYGINYEAVEHPLSPYYRVKATSAEWLATHPQPGGIAYRDWLSFVQQSDVRKPAKCVKSAQERLDRTGKARLAMFGYDMDNMKARGFVEAQMPLLIASSEDQRNVLETLTHRLVDSAVEVANLTVSQIKHARGDGVSLDLIRETFFKETETAFFTHLEAAFNSIEVGTVDLQSIGMEWLNGILALVALRTFDRHVQADAVVAIADLKAIKRAANARSILGAALKGYGPTGKSIFKALGMDVPQQKKKAKKGGGK